MILAFFIVLQIAIFWRTQLFFILDDWLALIQIVNNSLWHYLNKTDAEQYFPFFHLVYYLLANVFGDRYSLFLLVNCTATGINSFLIYLFFKRHLKIGVSLALSTIYCASVVHTATDWHAYNICYILALGFFLGGLLLTDSYLKSPNFGRLLGVGGCALLSILSHSYAIATISALPLYGLVLGGEKRWSRFWHLAGVILPVYLIFFLGYVTFAGVSAAQSHNDQLLSAFPGLAYVRFWVYGTLLFPASYLLGGDFSALLTLGFALPILGVFLAILLLWGNARENRLAAWGLFFNALPFLLVSLARYKMPIRQAASHRYGLFTLLTILLWTGLSWQILERRLQPGWRRLLPVPLLALMFIGQFWFMPKIFKTYERLSQEAWAVYQQTELNKEIPKERGLEKTAGGEETFSRIHPGLNYENARAIKLFLKGPHRL